LSKIQLLIVGILASIAEILPMILYLVFLKRNRGEGLWVIFLYCVLSILTELLYGITKRQFIFTGFIIVQFTLFSLFFYFSLIEKKLKFIPVIGAVVFYAVAISNFTNKRFDSLSASLASVLIIPYCILLLYEQIKDSGTQLVYYNKKFWVIIAFFIYSSATLFLYIYFSALSKEQVSSFWVINNFFEILKNILISISFIMKKRDKPAYAMDSLDT
jgi:hypothetical protein